MQIFLENKSDKTIIINLNGQSAVLKKAGSDFFSLSSNKVSMNLCADEDYGTDPVSEKTGFSFFHHFITVSQYDFTLTEDTAIMLCQETVHGDHEETYLRIVPSSDSFSFPQPIYTVKNEVAVRERMNTAKKKEKKAERNINILDKLASLQMNLGYALATIALIGIAILGFVALWQNFSPKTAVTLYAIFGFIVFAIKKLFDQIAKKVQKGTDKLFEKMDKSQKLNDAFQKLDDKLNPCGGKADEFYKNENSYFSPDYISAVFTHSQGRN